MATTIQIDDMITVGTLAEKLMLPVTRLIAELMKNGVMATVNEKIDFDTAEIIVSELDLDVELVRVEKDQAMAPRVRQRSTESKTAQSRAPVVAVMGHVDHGKTSLLDAIRGSQVAKGEAGGITQHISAYQIVHNDRPITFLDTPGHEAFAAIREHGARLTDIAIIVVAADDGIKPQTVEAIRYARQAAAKIIVAINKIDKEGADVNRTKQQLAEQNLMIEEWGGDTITMEVSAKTGKGIPELLDMVLLTADVDELRAEVAEPARGLIIEAHIEQGRGPVAHGLVESGTLHPGDFVVAGGAYAKLRNLETTTGKPIKQALPSTPVIMTGFKTLPEFGEEFNVVANEKAARADAQQFITQSQAGGSRQNISSSELIRMINRNNEVQPFNMIVKADVQGSLTSVINSLKALDTAEVATQLVSTGVGSITENDLHLAQTSQAVIYGFNVTMPGNIRQAASRDKVNVRLYNVIYELIDDVKVEMTKLLQPKIVDKELGRLIVRGVFKTTKTEVICGGEVTKGVLRVPAFARVLRDNEQLAEVEVTMLKRGPQETKEVNAGEMCGMSLKTEHRLELQEGDRLELFQRETVTREL
jgi:translation initiation factor IF-2